MVEKIQIWVSWDLGIGWWAIEVQREAKLPGHPGGRSVEGAVMPVTTWVHNNIPASLIHLPVGYEVARGITNDI